MSYTRPSLIDFSPLQIAGLYFSLAALWTVTTDVVLPAATEAYRAPAALEMATGWALVGLTSGFIYGIASVHQRRMDGTQRELETSNQQLQVLSRVLRHNIRNDLNVVRGYTNLLEDRISDDRSHQYLETIRETTDDIVDISRKLRMIEDADPDSADESVDLVAVVEETADDLRERDDVEIAVESPPTAWISGGSSISYPVREVFENAIAHNDKTVCRLDVRIVRGSETTLLEVGDNGPGIPESERTVLRAEQETPLSHASSIGLWLVKWMCELQGGTVTFDTDDGGDGGATVELRFLPAAEGDGAERAVDP